MTGGLVHTLAGFGVDVVIDKVKARFPCLEGAAERPSHHPGSAVTGMLAVVAGE